MIVTDIFQQYRMLLIFIWNQFFLPLLSSDAELVWEVTSEFRAASAVLLRELLMRKVALVLDLEPNVPLTFFIIPNARGAMGTRWATVRVSDQALNETGCTWGATELSIESSHMKLVFLDFFDWAEDSSRTFDFYRTKIEESPRYPELVGRCALIRVQDAKVSTVYELGGKGAHGLI